MKLNDTFGINEYGEGYEFAIANGYAIKDIGNKNYQIVEKTRPDAATLKNLKRAERDVAINGIIWRVERYEQQKTLNIATEESEETYLCLLRYIQYLRDIPESANFPEVTILNFDDWQEQETSKEAPINWE